MAVLHSAIVSTPSLNSLATTFRRPYFSASKRRAALQQLKPGSGVFCNSKSAAIADSLRVLEWDAVCDLVSSFAGTQFGRETVKAQLWSATELSYQETKVRLAETAAAIELIKYAPGGMDFAGIDLVLVKSAIGQAFKGFPVTGLEAIAVARLIEFALNLQATIKGAVKENADSYNHFLPLAAVIVNASICRSLAVSVKEIIDEDGYIKDTASSELKRYRDQVFMLERKLYQLMDKFSRNNKSESSSLEVCNVDGRWCIKYLSNKPENFNGLLLSSLGSDYLVEPIAAVELNDELQQARALVAKVEEDVLTQLTQKVAARAKYSIEYGASYPNIFLPCEMITSVTVDDGFRHNGTSRKSSSHHQRDWKLYLRKAHHPLLVKQYRQKLETAKKTLSNAASDVRRKKMQGKSMTTDDSDSLLDSMKLSILQMERCPPVPVDFVISAKATVLVITGPNTGGKTVSLKTIGLASLMSKAGLYVLASEPVKMPWFDAVYADIGDEQSLIQSLSTFSGHLKQISAIRSNSTSKSLVLLDEVGAGTNPLEGAALGMSLLESFADSGSFLTVATTHHGEVKTLKYSNHAFENACVEFDEESLQPTYRILWGIPGRSNAINIAEKLGLPYTILSAARRLHGETSAEINEIIIDMESSKQDFEHHLDEADHYLMLSRRLHQDLLMARERITMHSSIQIKRKANSVSEFAAVARSIIHTKLQQHRETAVEKNIEDRKQKPNLIASSNRSVGQTKGPDIGRTSHDKLLRIPELGETIVVPSLGKEAVVLEVLASKGEILVQASNIKLRLKLKDIVASV
ncbi:uncharacterized protein LOC110025737 isoform X2 [Phalaenopsis equestris]|uniref:uncharacterized protein LOC110025737 isoform X2 n=1 Tax=Phalaenopsis equestris TaxID=78828 RepID=UPI0009E60317|nr:uncharacterized protein LOC110025737 isoform X2 [Phalaenopsis equestris]